MNKYDEINITEVRDLLSRWYEAQTTEKEEQMLIEWFANACDEDIPSDLMADRKIFRAMAFDFGQSDTEIREAFRKAIGPTELKHNKRLWVKVGLYAAAASLVIFALIPIVADMLNTDVSNTDMERLFAVAAPLDNIVHSDTLLVPDHIIPSPDCVDSNNAVDIRNATRTDEISYEDSVRLLNMAYAKIDAAFRLTQEKRVMVEERMRHMDTVIYSAVERITVINRDIRPEILDNKISLIK